MRVLRVSCLLLALLAGTASTVLAEGFALNEWSARGVSLAGGMVGRADDVSALAYNAAGITQLPGTHVMGGLAFIAPLGTIGTEHATGMQYTTTKPSVWLAPHGYASYQLNDNVWLGMGVFSRFGLGNSYSGNWTGRYNLGLHMRFNEQWSVGLAYKSQVTVNLYGDVEFGSHEQNLLRAYQKLPEARDCNAHTTLQLPDSLALGVAYKPLDNLSFEAGTVWTRWSTYNALNIYMDNGYDSISNKEWRDGWNFNASVEYKPLDWWSLRAGLAYETAVVNEKHADFFVPSSGRTILSLGTGVEWNNWTVDFAYSHLWINPVSYDETDAAGIRGNAITGVTGGKSENVVANIYMFSIGYTF